MLYDNRPYPLLDTLSAKVKSKLKHLELVGQQSGIAFLFIASSNCIVTTKLLMQRMCQHFMAMSWQEVLVIKAGIRRF